MYGLSAEDLELQARARGFVNGLIPYEQEAELNEGELPEHVDKEFRAKAKELGLMATNMPKEFGVGAAVRCSSRFSSKSRWGGPPTCWRGWFRHRLRGFLLLQPTSSSNDG